MKIATTLKKELLRTIPHRWKEDFGRDFYERYLKLRVKFLNGRVQWYGADYKIEYTIIDQGKPEKLIFLPGFADTKENFYNAAQFLTNHCDMLIPDLPGFGRSFKRKGETYNLANYKVWMQDFIDQIGWTDFHLVGNSLGGAVAVELALCMPERIKSLTLVDCAGVVLKNHSSIYHEFVNERNIFEITTPLQFDYFLNRVFFTPPLIPPFVWDHLYREFSKHSKWHKKVLNDLLEGVKSMEDPRLEEFTLNHRLKDIRSPTTIIWGDEDSFFPVATADFIRSQIPGSTLYLLADRGHGPQVEAPLQFAQLMKKIMRRQKKA